MFVLVPVLVIMPVPVPVPVSACAYAWAAAWDCAHMSIAYIDLLSTFISRTYCNAMIISRYIDGPFTIQERDTPILTRDGYTDTPIYAKNVGWPARKKAGTSSYTDARSEPNGGSIR